MVDTKVQLKVYALREISSNLEQGFQIFSHTGDPHMVEEEF